VTSVSDPAFLAGYPSGSRVFVTKIGKNLQLNKNLINYFHQKLQFTWSKIAIYLSLGLHKGRPSYRHLQPSKENIQHLKTCKFLTFLYFCWTFLPSWIRIPTLDPDPRAWLNRIQSGSETLVATHKMHFLPSYPAAGKNGSQIISFIPLSHCLHVWHVICSCLREMSLLSALSLGTF
jgi:hypothetical protein